MDGWIDEGWMLERWIDDDVWIDRWMDRLIDNG